MEFIGSIICLLDKQDGIHFDYNINNWHPLPQSTEIYDDIYSLEYTGYLKFKRSGEFHYRTEKVGIDEKGLDWIKENNKKDPSVMDLSESIKPYLQKYLSLNKKQLFDLVFDKIKERV